MLNINKELVTDSIAVWNRLPPDQKLVLMKYMVGCLWRNKDGERFSDKEIKKILIYQLLELNTIVPPKDVTEMMSYILTYIAID